MAEVRLSYSSLDESETQAIMARLQAVADYLEAPDGEPILVHLGSRGIRRYVLMYGNGGAARYYSVSVDHLEWHLKVVLGLAAFEGGKDLEFFERMEAGNG